MYLEDLDLVAEMVVIFSFHIEALLYVGRWTIRSSLEEVLAID